MVSLLQARSIFNPLPLTEEHRPDLIPQIQSVATTAYKLFLNGSEEEKQASLQLIKELSMRKTQGLLWNQGLKEKTVLFWKPCIEPGEFQNCYIIFICF